jgi:hypothetical protein
MIMMNVKETLRRLHKKYPTLSLDELFEMLDCYVEQIDYSNYFKPITTFNGNLTTNTAEDSLQLKADR